MRALNGLAAVRPRTAQASRQLTADLALLGVAVIWGATFVMVKDAVRAFPVFSFMAVRFALASAALGLVVLARHLYRGRAALAQPAAGPNAQGRVLISGRRRPVPGIEALAGLSAPRHRPPKGSIPHTRPQREMHPSAQRLRAPLLIGLALFAGYALQTAGLALTTPAKAGFITGLSVVIVPLVAARLLRQAPGRSAWFGVGLATLGLALLSLTADFRIAPGDLLVLGCAVSFAGHILLTGHFAPRHDPLLLTLGQALAVTLLSGTAALLFDAPALGLPALAGLLDGRVLFAAAFTGLLATAAAFGIQTVAQRFTTATHTALIFAAEPVFAGLFSFLLIGEVLGPRQLFGCALILAGMVAAEMRRPA